MKHHTANASLAFRIACVSLVALASVQAATHRLNSTEMKLFRLVSKDKGQQRGKLVPDPILCRVARKRAADMVRRDYFSHTNPDGFGANRLVSKAGFLLPSYYPKEKDANNIESIGMGAISASGVLAMWKKSSGHRPHLLGEIPFYRDQTRIGIGVARKPGTTTDYFVFISAPPNLNPRPPYWVLKDPSGKVISTTRTSMRKGMLWLTVRHGTDSSRRPRQTIEYTKATACPPGTKHE